MIPIKLYRATVTTQLVVEAKDEHEARQVVGNDAFIEGMTCQIDELVELKSEADLPPGWTPESLAFCLCEPELSDERNIGKRLEELARAESTVSVNWVIELRGQRAADPLCWIAAGGGEPERTYDILMAEVYSTKQEAIENARAFSDKFPDQRCYARPMDVPSYYLPVVLNKDQMSQLNEAYSTDQRTNFANTRSYVLSLHPTFDNVAQKIWREAGRPYCRSFQVRICSNTGQCGLEPKPD